MILTIFIALGSLLALVIIHEFGHFILAKRFGTKVEEFGIGYPPRLFGKKIGDTLYSLNLLPFGAFVKIHGEEGGIEDYRSFAQKPIWQRILIVFGGVVSFWLVAFLLLSVVAGVWGLPTAVLDEDNDNLVNPKVQITQIIPDSPASGADLKMGDVIKELAVDGQVLKIDKVKEVQEFIKANKDKEITLVIQRGRDSFDKKVMPRKEGTIGVGLTRIALKPYSWYQAPLQGVIASARLTWNIIDGWILGVQNLLGIAKLPAGVSMEMMGPLGILDLLGEYFQLGINYFLFLISLISVALALANILPIPALDGGKLVFLTIEAVRGKPINYKLEQKISGASFILLIILTIFITIKFDIPRVF